MPTIIITDIPELIEELDKYVTLDYTDEDFDNYYCINIKPFQCRGCGEVIAYAQCGPHLIIIWDTNDHEMILQAAAYLQSDSDFEPRIVRYNRILGPCVKFEDALERGWLEDITHGT